MESGMNNFILRRIIVGKEERTIGLVNN